MANTQESTRSKRNHSNKRTVIVIIAAVVVALLLAGYVVFFSPWSHFFVTKKSSTVKPALPQTMIVGGKADAALANGDKASAQKTYDDAIASTKNDSDKAALMLEQANSYRGVQDYQDALTAALGAEKYAQSNPGILLINIDSAIASIYLSINDPKNASIYYGKVVSLIDSTHAQGFDRAYYVQLANSSGAQ